MWSSSGASGSGPAGTVVLPCDLGYAWAVGWPARFAVALQAQASVLPAGVGVSSLFNMILWSWDLTRHSVGLSEFLLFAILAPSAPTLGLGQVRG